MGELECKQGINSGQSTYWAENLYEDTERIRD